MKWRQTECIKYTERAALIQQEARARRIPAEDLHARATRAGVLTLRDGRQLIHDARWYLRTPERQAVAQ